MKKDITFIYSDSAERAIYQPIAKEAEKRGYIVHLTENPFQKCEIGVYCQHMNYPQYSKFSIIMLHDIIQGYNRWPDIFFKEPWNKYDIGILPNQQWAKNWIASSSSFYAVPRIGTYIVGWPKADTIVSLKNDSYRKQFNEEHCLDASRRTVLYAPAWENDGKEDDFVKAMAGLNVNVIIKQWDADPKKFPKQVYEVNRMKELHNGIDNVTILPPSTNIFEAIAASDILVSEESSTMCEAAMMGIPAVSVSNWLIPDTEPSRYPKCDYDFVTMTKKEQLKDCIYSMLSDYDSIKTKTQEYANNTFLNIGRSSSMIMDIIDDCLDGKEIRYERLQRMPYRKLSLAQHMKFLYCQAKVQLGGNYFKRTNFGKVIWRLAQKVNAIRRKMI